MKVSLVFPVYHNQENLPDLFDALSKLDSRAEYEFVFVDDGSADGSWAVLEEYALKEPRAKAIRLSRNFGAINASFAGIAHAAGDAAIVMPADLQDPPELIPQMIDLWVRGHEVVVALRKSRSDPFLTGMFTSVFYFLMKYFARLDTPKGGFSTYLMDRKVMRVLVESQDRNSAIMPMIWWTGFRRGIVTYDRQARKKGRSMFTFTKRLKLFIDCFVSFSYAPIRAIQLVGGLACLTAFALAVYAAVMRLSGTTPVHGWASVLVATLAMGGGNLLMLGVIGEYIWRTLDGTKKRPLFVLDQIVTHESAKTSERQ